MNFDRELVVLHTTSSMFGKLWCFLGGKFGALNKNVLYRFVEAQTHLGMQQMLT